MVWSILTFCIKTSESATAAIIQSSLQVRLVTHICMRLALVVISLQVGLYASFISDSELVVMMWWNHLLRRRGLYLRDNFKLLSDDGQQEGLAGTLFMYLAGSIDY